MILFLSCGFCQIGMCVWPWKVGHWNLSLFDEWEFSKMKVDSFHANCGIEWLGLKSRANWQTSNRLLRYFQYSSLLTSNKTSSSFAQWILTEKSINFLLTQILLCWWRGYGRRTCIIQRKIKSVSRRFDS